MILVHTDLVLPGNAGVDLRIQRAFNSKGSQVGPLGRWTFGPGQILYADPIPGIRNPHIWTGDGAEHHTYALTEGGSIFSTAQWWLYDRPNHTLSLPNGTTILYGYYWNAENQNERYPTEVTDSFGNRITYWYTLTPIGPAVERIVQQLGSGQAREVMFTYDGSGLPATMTYAGRTWTYHWDGPKLLREVVPPFGSSWQYGYDDGFRVNHVVTPNGGEVFYTYKRYEPESPSMAIDQRRSAGRAVWEGTWSFTYGGPSYHTTIDSPG